MGLLGGLGDIMVNKVKNAVSQGLLGAKQHIGDAWNTLVKYTDPVEGIKAVTPMIQNKFPAVGSALKKGTDFIDNLRNKFKTYSFLHLNNAPAVSNKKSVYSNKERLKEYLDQINAPRITAREDFLMSLNRNKPNNDN